MSSEEHVIDITVQTHDKVAPGLEKAQSSLRSFDKAIEKTQARLSKLARSDYEVAIRAIDRVRKKYCTYYTNTSFGSMEQYDIALNSSRIGVDACVRAVLALAKEDN